MNPQKTIWTMSPSTLSLLLSFQMLRSSVKSIRMPLLLDSSCYLAAVIKRQEVVENHGGSVMVFNMRYYRAYSESFWCISDFSGDSLEEQASHSNPLACFLVG